ncbi:SLAP domain-containing protein [Bacillus sp. JJ1533]|uniref:SLAP domain-containing protein n=1 Tax=Bacillus sp. JJ1533 TaxID=3122959 RepID=UPI002FFFA217
MHKLLFEEAWDRTISQKDREEIQHIFHEAVTKLKTGVTLTTVRVAVNHKNERLVTTLVHNKTDQKLFFENTIIEIWAGEDRLAQHHFTLPALQVPPETSMPWTFIFPVGFEVPASATLRLKKEK